MSENTLNGSSVYNELRLEQELCDAVIRVDGVEIHVHKIILCKCSPYFRALFTHWSTPHCRVFDIPNVSLDMMKFIVEFAYTGRVSVAQENIRELFIAADQFNVQGIIQACSEYMENQLVPQNCIGIWSFSDVYYTRELKNKAYAFLLSHFEEVASSSAEFLQLSAQELVKLLENDHLNVKKEKKVFEAIIHWINHAPEERSGYITLLLSSVRLALISPKYLVDSVAKNELVEASEERLGIVITALDTVLHLRTRGLPDLIPLHPMARPRLPSAFLLAFGGWSGGAPTSSFASYDNRAECWVSITGDEAEPRAYHGTAFLNGSLYCVGGFNGVVQFNTMKRFDLTTQTWQEVAPMHSKRCYVSVTVLDGQIYALGGYDGHHRLETAERYEPSTNQWTLIAPMHRSRSDASCTTLQGKVYICGGFNGTDCLSSAERYNPKTDQWTLIAPMGSSRSGVGVIAYADHVFAVGGFNGISRLRTAEFYNPLTNTWRDVPSMLNPRSNFGIEVIEDHIFVAGGFNGLSTTADVECYDFDTSEWSDVSDLEISCSALSCCVVYGLPNMAEYAAPRHFLQLLDEEPDEVE